MTIGECIKNIRHSEGLTLKELGEKVGLSYSYLSQIESGKRKPSPEILERIANAFNIPHVELMIEAGYLEKSSINAIDNLETINNFIEYCNNLKEVSGLDVNNVPVFYSEDEAREYFKKHGADYDEYQNKALEAQNAENNLRTKESKEDVQNALILLINHIISNPSATFNGESINETTKEFLIESFAYVMQQAEKINQK